MSDLVITPVVYALGSDCTGVGSNPSDVNLMRLVFHAQTNLPEAVSNGHKTTTHALHRGSKTATGWHNMVPELCFPRGARRAYERA